ncbi:transporter [Salibacterium salarium]|uniref:Transporter n=1 Tax=Salibacterium salarium TaxID=284579 RepID=A0A428N5H2_9BACI|nr:NCS1 family transporter [Salibacterium salarium]RSL33529.1 transporter [Salibacterium salarium]
MQNQELAPILSEKERILGPKAYVAMWWGDTIMVGTFMLGSSLIPPFGDLNLFQAIAALLLANVIAALLFSLNGKVGWKHGIPMVVQLRSSFGPVGAKVPSLFRSIPALFWFGIQTWLGAEALNQIASSITGFDNVWIWFFGFQFLQIFLSAKGIKSIKWIEIIGSIIIMLGVIYLIFLFLSTFGLEVQNSTDIDGSWGIPLWMAMGVLIGQFAALLLNVSDYTRYFPRKKKTSTFVGAHLVGLVPPSILLPFIGMLGAAAVGIWNPVDVISEYIPSVTASIIVLFFIALAQVTTNLVANIMPPALVAMEFFKISWTKACVIIGITAIFTCPWWLMSDDYFTLFIAIVSAFLGPILGVMVSDFYLIHKRNYNVKKLYDKENLFRAFNGWNPAAIIAIIAGTCLSFINVDASWFLGGLPAAIVYYVLMKFWMVHHESYIREGMNQSFTETPEYSADSEEASGY